MAESEMKEKLAELRARYHEEQERVHREASEVDVMVRQTATDVEKLSQRELSVSNRVRDLEINIDRYSKAEIKNFYTAAQEVQMRLQMMRSQLEQLQLRQGAMRARQTQLSEVVEVLDEMLDLNAPNSTAEENGASADDNLIANIIQSQENERKRISLQMHDGPAQAMGNLVLRAQICERLIEHDVNQARSELTSLKTAINSTLQDIRKFIFDLHPMTLEDLGLIRTLRRFVTEFSDKHKIEVNFMVQNMDDARLPSLYEVTLFRFIQEALDNVVQHSKSAQARVLINATDTMLQLVIEDDGSGFHVSETLSDRSGRRNMGIASMRQQIESLLRGEFGIESAIGRGTRIAATIPLPSA